MSSKDISVIIISYNTWHFLDACVESIKKNFKSISYEIIVVDNNSTDGSINCIENKYPDIVLIRNEENAGFARANNQAIKISRGRYCFLLNADTQILDDQIINAIRFLDARSRVGILAPQQIMPDGNCAVSLSYDRNFKKHKMSILKNACYYKHKEMRCTIPKNITSVGYVNGAAMIIRKSLLNSIGLLDERFFFMAEEKDFAFRCHAASFDVVYYPHCKLLHYGASGKGLTLWGLMQYHYSNLKLFKKYHSSELFAASIFILGLLTGSAASTLSFLFKRDRSIYQHRILIYLKTLIWHFSCHKINWRMNVR